MAIDELRFWLLGVPGVCAAYLTLAWFFPSLLTPIWWVLLHLHHRFHVHGREHVPAKGPVLIVSNHVSYMDWMMLWMACPRPLTFVLWEGYRRNPVLRFFLSFVRHRVVYLDNRSAAPHAVSAALDAITAALDAGRAVLLFPEGRLTRNGQMRPFHRGVEWILQRTKESVSVVPACVWNVWGNLLSHKGRLFFRRPAEFRRRIAVGFGRPLPKESSAAEIRAGVVETLAECGQFQSDYTIPVHSGFVRKAAHWSNIRKPAFVDTSTGSERILTWPKALVGAWALADWLKPHLTSDKNVAVWLPTGIGSALSNIALALLRKTSVNLNYTAGSHAVAAAVAGAGVRTVVSSRRFEARMPLELPADVKRIYVEDALAGISSISKVMKLIVILLCPGWFLDRVVLRTRRFRMDDLLTIIFSSGSTGDPKGVMLSLRNVSSNADGFQKGVNFTTRDRMLCTLPIFHSFGYTVCLWAPASIGMAAIFHADPRAAKEIGELSKRWNCTIALATATFLRFYLRRCEPDDFRSVRLFICGAEKLPVPLAEEFQARFGVLPLEGYGCTELSPVVSANLPDVHIHGVAQKANTPGTVGQPIPGVVARAFEVESRLPLPPGEDGVLCVKGASVMVGYLHKPEETARVISNGWYWTGDVGHVTADGFIRITGRLSRFAKIAGEMVPLERLEEEVMTVLGCHGDRLLAVAAVPDLKRGERLVVLHLPDIASKLRDAFETLRKRGVPNLWIPDDRDFHTVDAFPVLGSGKLDLRGLGDLARKLVGLPTAG